MISTTHTTPSVAPLHRPRLRLGLVATTAEHFDYHIEGHPSITRVLMPVKVARGDRLVAYQGTLELRILWAGDLYTTLQRVQPSTRTLAG